MDNDQENEYWRDKFKKEIEEMNQDSEEESILLEEEELEAILESVENETFNDPDDAEEFFNKKLEEINMVRKKMYKPRPRVIKETNVYEEFFTKQETESIFNGTFFMDEKTEKQMIFNFDNRIGRYPEGWRHLENFINYRQKFPNA